MNGGSRRPPGSGAEASAHDPSESAFEGTILEGAYRVNGILGEGGMGAVYEGQQLRLNKRVAIKVMSRDLAANQEALARFRREAEVTSSIGHPHIVHVFDFGNTPTGEPFMVMEFLDGEDLESRLRRLGRLPPESVVHVIKQVASALTATHKQGIVHRDLKPANIYLLDVAGEVDFVKVVDFGISKVRAAVTRLTQASVVMGSPQYMSPEQALGHVDEIDPTTDEWALACITWEVLSGRCPFTGENVASLLYQVVHEDPPPLAIDVTGLNPAVEEVLLRALAKRREDRFPTVSAFARALEDAVQGSTAAHDPTPAPRHTDLGKDTAAYGRAATVFRPSTIPPQEQKPTLTTLSHSAGEATRRIGRGSPSAGRLLAIAGGSLLVLLFGAFLFLFFRSGGPVKDKATGLPPQAPTMAPPNVTVTPPPPPPPPEQVQANQQVPEAQRAIEKPLEKPAVSPAPRPRVKVKRRLITDI